MASIQIKRDSFIIQYYVNGKRKTKSTGIKVGTGKDKQVDRMKKDIEARLALERSLPKEQRTLNSLPLSQAVRKFKEVHLSLKSVSHRDNYLFSMNHLMKTIGKTKPVSEITTEDISEYILELKNSVKNSTMHTYIRYAKMLFNYLAEENYIVKTPFRKRQNPKREDIEIETFEKDDLNSILGYTYEHDRKMYLFLSLLLLLGTRPIDLINLRYGDIKMDQRKIVIKMAKTGNLILFPIYNELGKFLLDNFPNILETDGEEFIFPRYSVSHVGKKFRKFLRYLEIPKIKRYTLKTFRKTFGTNMAALNIPTKDLMYLMGHREVNTTLKYYVKSKADEIEKKINQTSYVHQGMADKQQTNSRQKSGNHSFVSVNKKVMKKPSILN